MLLAGEDNLIDLAEVIVVTDPPCPDVAILLGLSAGDDLETLERDVDDLLVDVAPEIVDHVHDAREGL